MLKGIIIFAVGFIIGVAFAVNAMVEGEKKMKSPKLESEKSPGKKISISIPYDRVKARSRESAMDAVRMILERYHANGNMLSVKEYNDIFGFNQTNPLHAMVGWISGEDLDIKVERSNDGTGYIIAMPTLCALR